MSTLGKIGAALLLELAFAKPALAQVATGDAACGQVFDEAAPGCAPIAALETTLKELGKTKRKLDRILEDASKTPDEKAAAQAELSALPAKVTAAKDEIGRLTDTPFEALPRFCSSLKTSTPRTCDSLATRLGAFDVGSLDSLKKAAQASESTETDALLRRAAAADRQTANNKSGSSAQLDPVESVQPITLAGGALSLSGTRTGSKGVGTISVNPLAIAFPKDVRAARLADLSVSAPFDLAGSSANEDPYISTRLRVNITGPFRAAELQKDVDRWLSASGIYADNLTKVLRNAKDVKACARYVAVNQRAGIAACEQNVDSADVRHAREAAYGAMARARREADQCYLGVDARFDNGDPTGPGIGHDLGRHWLGGLAAGTRLPQGNLWDWELRGRAGIDLFKSTDPTDEKARLVGSVDWGGALIFSGRLQESAKQRMAFGVGAEGRHAWKDDENAKRSPTNYVKLNLMAVVPAVTGGDLGLALGVPLWELREVRGVMVNFSTDLGLLDHSL